MRLSLIKTHFNAAEKHAVFIRRGERFLIVAFSNILLWKFCLDYLL